MRDAIRGRLIAELQRARHVQGGDPRTEWRVDMGQPQCSVSSLVTVAGHGMAGRARAGQCVGRRKVYCSKARECVGRIVALGCHRMRYGVERCGNVPDECACAGGSR